MTRSGNSRIAHPLAKASLAWLLAFALAFQMPLLALAEDEASPESIGETAAEEGSDEDSDEESDEQETPSLIETLFPDFEIIALRSPDLLAGSASSNSAASTSADDQPFDYTDSYAAALDAASGYDQIYSVTRGTLMPDHCAALVRSGSTLLFVDGRLVKLGDASDSTQATEYGTNSVATVLGEGANMLLVNSLLESSALGSPAIMAVNGGLALAQNANIRTGLQLSSALATSYGGTILANALQAHTDGTLSPATHVTTSRGAVSAANSSFTTASQGSPLVQAKGRIELDNVSGVASNSPLALLQDKGALVLQGSRLVSSQQEVTPDQPSGGAIMLYREDAVAQETLHDDTVFQATDSSIRSELQSGSLFYLTNTRAKVILSNTNLEFDDQNMALLTAVGNNSKGWGTQGSNGASATFTAINQTMQGDVIVDAQSSVDLFLLDESTWRGSARNVASGSGSLISDQLNVSVDGNSTWVVPSNSTVTNLNLAVGAKLVDPQGKGVKIHDGNGFSLVDGASDVTVTVTGSFSSTVKTTSDNVPEGSQIDRAAFDDTFGLQTTFGTNESSVYTPEELRVARLAYALQGWFKSI